METKIKQNQVDVNWESLGGSSLNEFVVTNDIYDTYKVEYYAGGDVLDIAGMIEGENLNDGTINFNGFNGYFNNAEYTSTNFTFKNANTIYFDNPESEGCETGITFNSCGIIFQDIQNIQVSKGITANVGIIELDKAQDNDWGGELKFINCGISANFANSKSFVLFKEEGINVVLQNCVMNLNCANDLEDYDVDINFVQATANNCKVSIENCSSIRIANDNKNNDDTTNNLIVTDEDVTVGIEIINSIIRMQGKGSGNIVNINLDNQSCNIDTNYLNGILKVRYESAHTISKMLANADGGTFTLEEGDRIWDDIVMKPELNDFGFIGISITDSDLFLQEVGIGADDFQYNGRNYQLMYTGTGTYGWDLNWNDGEQDQTLTDINPASYGIDTTGHNLEPNNLVEIIVEINLKQYQATQQITISSTADFYSAITNEDLQDVGFPQVNEFSNNAVQQFDGETSFFTNSAESLVARELTLNNRKYSSLNLYDLDNIDRGSVENAEENSVLMFQNGQWVATTLSDLKDMLDNLSNN